MVRSRHVVPHIVWPAAQPIMPPGAHAPDRHTSPVAQRRLHAPQWNGSVAVIAQNPEQLVAPAAHMTVPASITPVGI